MGAEEFTARVLALGTDSHGVCSQVADAMGGYVVEPGVWRLDSSSSILLLDSRWEGPTIQFALCCGLDAAERCGMLLDELLATVAGATVHAYPTAAGSNGRYEYPGTARRDITSAVVEDATVSVTNWQAEFGSRTFKLTPDEATVLFFMGGGLHQEGTGNISLSINQLPDGAATLLVGESPSGIRPQRSDGALGRRYRLSGVRGTVDSVAVDQRSLDLTVHDGLLCLRFHRSGVETIQVIFESAQREGQGTLPTTSTKS